MTNTVNLKHGIIAKNYYGYQGAIYKNKKVFIKEITSNKVKVETNTGKIYWLDSEYLIIN
jgi:hypothetical protein